MTSATLQKADAISVVPPIDWTNVRPVYKKLQDQLHQLTDPFGIVVSPTTKRHLAHLIATIDAVDRKLDSIVDQKERINFAAKLVAFLIGTEHRFESKYATKEIAWRMFCLRNVIVAAGIQVEFAETIRMILEHTEAKRLANTQTEMIRQMREEWRLTGHLTVLVLGKASTERFEKFFYLLCETMPAVDMIQDAGEDFRNGHISTKPNLALYARLLTEFLLPLPKLIWMFPKPIDLLQYTLSFIRETYFPSRHAR